MVCISPRRETGVEKEATPLATSPTPTPQPAESTTVSRQCENLYMLYEVVEGS